MRYTYTVTRTLVYTCDIEAPTAEIARAFGDATPMLRMVEVGDGREPGRVRFHDVAHWHDLDFVVGPNGEDLTAAAAEFVEDHRNCAAGDFANTWNGTTVPDFVELRDSYLDKLQQDGEGAEFGESVQLTAAGAWAHDWRALAVEAAAREEERIAAMVAAAEDDALGV